MFSKTFKGIGGGIKGALGGALSPLGVGIGALGLGAIGKEVLDFEGTLTDLKIQAGATGDDMSGLRTVIDDLSKSNAIGKSELAALALEMVNLEGKAGLNADKLKVLGDAAFATSAPVAELAGLSLALGNAFKLTDAEGMRAGLDGIITAGKEGSIPLSEMNLLLQQNGASFKKFTKEGAEGAAIMAATLQGLRKEAGSAGEAGTRLGAVMVAFQTREVELRKMGVEVKAVGGGYKKLDEIIGQIDQSGLLKDAEKYKKALGVRKEVKLGIEALVSQKDEIVRIIGETKKLGTIEADTAERRKQDSFKIKKAFNDIKLTIAEAFTPARIKKFASAMGKLAKVVGFIADNVEVFVALLVSIKIGSLVSGFSAMAASTGVMSKNTAMMSGAMSKVGAAAGVAQAAIAGWAIGKALDDALGISDAISDLALPSAADKKRFGGASLKGLGNTVVNQANAKRAQDIDAKTGGSQFTDLNQRLGGEQFDMGKAFNRSQRLAGEAKRLGLVGKGGKVGKRAVFEATTGRAALEGNIGKSQMDKAGTAELVSAIEQALRIEAVAKKAEAAGLDITIKVDEKGLLKAEILRDKESRRAPQ
jgi:hypothetical protein